MAASAFYDQDNQQSATRQLVKQKIPVEWIYLQEFN